MEFTEQELKQIIRECYAVQIEAANRMKERKAINVETGDTMLACLDGLRIKEREQAAERVRTVCIRHGFDLIGEE